MLLKSEALNIIIDSDPYFNDNDSINRISMRILDLDSKQELKFECRTSALEEFIDLLTQHLDNANKPEYIP